MGENSNFFLSVEIIERIQLKTAEMSVHLDGNTFDAAGGEKVYVVEVSTGIS